MKEAINEFVDSSGGVEAQLGTAASGNTRVLVIFTSKFNLSDAEDSEINQVIFNLHALKINVVFFGYEIGLTRRLAELSYDPVLSDQTLTARTFDEHEVLKFRDRVLAFDMKKSILKTKKENKNKEIIILKSGATSVRNSDNSSDHNGDRSVQNEDMLNDVASSPAAISFSYVERPGLSTTIPDEFSKFANSDMNRDENTMILETFE